MRKISPTLFGWLVILVIALLAFFFSSCKNTKQIQKQETTQQATVKEESKQTATKTRERQKGVSSQRKKTVVTRDSGQVTTVVYNPSFTDGKLAKADSMKTFEQKKKTKEKHEEENKQDTSSSRETAFAEQHLKKDSTGQQQVKTVQKEKESTSPWLFISLIPVALLIIYLVYRRLK